MSIQHLTASAVAGNTNQDFVTPAENGVAGDAFDCDFLVEDSHVGAGV